MPTEPPKFSIGVDFGTNSVRALIVDLRDGAEIASSVFDYPSGEAGVLLDPADPNLARQNPADYIAGFEQSVAGAVRAAADQPGFAPDRVVGIGIDTTGSTPLPIDRNGQALALHEEFAGELDAQAWLWKDHTSHAEAAEITRRAREGGYGYLAKCGGAYSSEWFWSKMLHCERTNSRVAQAAYSWIEQADFVPAFVTGNTDPHTLARGICAAGHKAMYHPNWGGLPSAEFLESLQPGFARFRERYAAPAVPSDHKAGGLTAALAERVGLPAGIPVAVGAIDAHCGAIGAGCGPGTLVKIMGTSTCDCMVAPLAQKLPDVPGLCGIVPESIIPGMHGLEAGQSAVGDIFNWFVQRIAPAGFGAADDMHRGLSDAAARLKPGESGLLALDWNNGNRCVLVDPLLTGLLIGQTLHTAPPEIYRALLEATAFGSLAIINRLEEYGVKVEQVVNCGGIAEKSPLVMQIYADVCNRPMKLSRSSQTCALGAAICGAVVGGGYKSVPDAQARMTGVKETVYNPQPAAARVYQRLFALYMQLHDAFGTTGHQGSLHNVMKDLIALRNEVRKGG